MCKRRAELCVPSLLKTLLQSLPSAINCFPLHQGDTSGLFGATTAAMTSAWVAPLASQPFLQSGPAAPHPPPPTQHTHTPPGSLSPLTPSIALTCLPPHVTATRVFLGSELVLWSAERGGTCGRGSGVAG